MWKNTRMIVLVAITSSIFASILIPFKGIQLIPGITEIRPASIIPVVFGLLFGPAGAWGSCFGNIIGDIFGTFSLGSFFGAIGNFYFALVSYKLWENLPFFDSEVTPDIKRKADLTKFFIVSIVASMTVAFIIAWGLEILRLTPFAVLAPIITINNSLSNVFIGPILLKILYPRVERWGLLWREVMEIPFEKKKTLGSFLILIGVLGGWLSGILISTQVYQARLFSFGSGETSLSLVLNLLPFLVILLIGTLL